MMRFLADLFTNPRYDRQWFVIGVLVVVVGGAMLFAMHEVDVAFGVH
jgi:hypothetical protein